MRAGLDVGNSAAVTSWYDGGLRLAPDTEAIDATQVEATEQLVALLKKSPELLITRPELRFFKTYLQSLGAKLPVTLDKSGPAYEYAQEMIKTGNYDPYFFIADPMPRSPYLIVDRKGTEILDLVGPPDIRHDMSWRTQRTPDSNGKQQQADALGSGAFGQVFLGRSAEYGRVAIKVTPILDENRDGIADQQKFLEREADVLAAVRRQSTIARRPGTEMATAFKAQFPELDGLRSVTLPREGAFFPKVFYYGTQMVFGRPSEVLVMEMLGDSLQKRCFNCASNEGGCEDAFCKGVAYTRPAILHVGREVVRALRTLHNAGFVHNDLKPLNLIFGPKDSAREGHIHLIDFGMVSSIGEPASNSAEGVNYGGGTPMFASVAALEGRPTRPVDDVESLWYLLAFLAQGTENALGTLPWQWESPERVAIIKKQMFVDGCAIATEDGQVIDAAAVCKTQHCKDTIANWMKNQLCTDCTTEACGVTQDALVALWTQVLIANASPAGEIDYDACLDALGGGLSEDSTFVV